MSIKVPQRFIICWMTSFTSEVCQVKVFDNLQFDCGNYIFYFWVINCFCFIDDVFFVLFLILDNLFVICIKPLDGGWWLPSPRLTFDLDLSIHIEKKVLGKKFWIKPVWHMQTKPQFIDQGVVLLVIKTIPQKIPFPTLTSLDSITSIAAPFWITGALGFTSTVTLNIIKI